MIARAFIFQSWSVRAARCRNSQARPVFRHETIPCSVILLFRRVARCGWTCKSNRIRITKSLDPKINFERDENKELNERDENKPRAVTTLYSRLRQLITSQMRHDNNEKHVESIVQCTTIQYKTVSSSLLSYLSFYIFSFRLIFTKEVRWATSAKRSRIDKIRPSAIGIYENQLKFDESNSDNPHRDQN